MKNVLTLVLLFLSGCASTSDPNLLKGELFVGKKITDKGVLEQKIQLDKKNIYEITISFR